MACYLKSNTDLDRDFDEPKQIGIIGGSGPEAGINVMENILKTHKEFKGDAYKNDKDAPYIQLMQVPGVGGPHGRWDLEDEDSKDYKYLWQSITNTIRRLVMCDVDYFCMTCNTLHFLEGRMREWMAQNKIDPKRFVSIVEATKDAIQNDFDMQNLGASNESPARNRVAILGSLLTTDVTGNSPYRNLVTEDGELEFVQLPVAMRENLQELINLTKQYGPREDVMDRFQQEITDPICDPNGSFRASYIVLACTELPLLADQARQDRMEAEFGVECMDPNAVLASTLLEYAEYTTPKQAPMGMTRSATCSTNACCASTSSDVSSDDGHDETDETMSD